MYRINLVSLFVCLACGVPNDGSESDASTGTGEPTTSSTSTTAGMSSTTSGETDSSGSDSTSVTTDEPTTSTDPSETDPTEDTTSPFIVDADTPSLVECDHFEQDTCPEGQKCMPYNSDGGSTWNALKCVAVMGTGTHGDPCTVIESGVSGLDDCAQGHMCFSVDPQTLMGECFAFCSGSVDNPICVPEDTYCKISAEGTLPLCFPECDPLLQNCHEGFACYFLDFLDGFSCEPDAAQPDAGQEGDVCEYLNACHPGFGCISNWPDCPGTGCCAPFCDLNDPVCNTPGTECVAILSNPEPDDTHIGQCMEPE